MCDAHCQGERKPLSVGAQGLVLHPQAVNQVALEPEHAAGIQTLLLGAGQAFSFSNWYYCPCFKITNEFFEYHFLLSCLDKSNNSINLEEEHCFTKD